MCWKGKSLECCREVALREALSEPVSPDAADALRLFEACATQWRVGFSGPTGLDYAGAAVVAQAMGLDFVSLFPFVQVLEVDQLLAWAEDRKRDEKKVKRG
jgi:hypothetical protein